jgi:hypothetical protein
MKDTAESQHLVFVVQKHKATRLHYDFFTVSGRSLAEIAAKPLSPP